MGYMQQLDDADADHSDYKPELQRLAKEKETKAEAAKTANLERAMNDIRLGEPSSKGNPFGPYPRSDREDRYYDDEGGVDSDEEEQIRRQMEMEEEAEAAEDLDVNDMAPPEPGIGGAAGRGQGGPGGGISWPAPM